MTDQTNDGSRGGSLWAWVPALLLGSMVTGLGTLAYIAVDDPGFALEPNYYDKAVHWDQRQAELRAGQALGLKLGLSPLTLGAGDKVELELTVQDRHGSPLLGAEVRLDAFPNASASHVQQLLLREARPGVYTGELTRGVRGLWEMRVSVKQGAATYRESLRRDVNKGDAA
jgi:nitrogen fixation protein FixH